MRLSAYGLLQVPPLNDAVQAASCKTCTHFVFTALHLIVCTAPDARGQESACMREHAHESGGSAVMTRQSGLYYSIELLRAAHV